MSCRRLSEIWRNIDDELVEADLWSEISLTNPIDELYELCRSLRKECKLNAKRIIPNEYRLRWIYQKYSECGDRGDFEQLPVEILLNIAGYLPWRDYSAVMFTCGNLYGLLGPGYKQCVTDTYNRENGDSLPWPYVTKEQLDEDLNSLHDGYDCGYNC